MNLQLFEWPEPEGVNGRFEMANRAIDRTPNKRAPNQGRSGNPRQGAYRTCPGRRPFWGRGNKALLLYLGLGGFSRKQRLDATRVNSNFCSRAQLAQLSVSIQTVGQNQDR